MKVATGNGTGDDRGNSVPADAGMGGDSRLTFRDSDMGPATGHSVSAGSQRGTSEPSSAGHEGNAAKVYGGDRDYPLRSPKFHRSSAGPQGLILGRLYRILFGALPDTGHDDIVRAAHRRVNAALEGLDRDVLTLMKVALEPIPDENTAADRH